MTLAALSDAQFAFVGTVASVDERVHPWTTDPENPDRADVARATRWVTFDVERWYTTDWGASFSLWAPAFPMSVGERYAVGGDAYHTEVAGFSGQSGEIEFCASLTDAESSHPAWDRYFGDGTAPTTADPDADDPPIAPATKSFGEHGGPCAPTVLTNGADDERLLDDGVTCFLQEFTAGTPLVWDVVVATTEGSPIPSRFDYDGVTVTITTDYSFDTFGTPGVAELRCTGVRPTDWLPEGTDCVSADGEGFRAESMPF